MKFKMMIAYISLLSLVCIISDVGAEGLWKIDFQGGENHGGHVGQTDPVDMTEPGIYWNICEVPAFDDWETTSYILNPSWQLRDNEGTLTSVTLSITGQVYGWAGDVYQEADPLRGDYLILLNDFGLYNADPLGFQITGLTPNAGYFITLYHCLNMASRGLEFDIEGVSTVLVGWPPEAAVDTLWVTTNETGTLTGVAASSGYEGDWSGMIISAPFMAYNPDPADGATQVPLDKVLTWTTGRDPNFADIINPDITKHYVWMSSGSPTDPNLVLVDTITTITETGSYNPGGMNRDEKYWWRVDEGIGDYPIGDPNNIVGEVWSFETLPSVVIIEQQPQDVLTFAGEDVVYTVAAINPFTGDSSGLIYAWYKVGDDITVLSSTDTLTIVGAQLSDEGSYYCVVGVIGTPGSESTTESASLILKKVMFNVPLDGNLEDVSGYGYIGVLTGEATYSTDAVLGQSISLDGNGDYANFGDVVITDTGLISISVWAKPDSITRNWNAILAKWAADASTKTFWFGQHDYDGWLRFGIYPNNDPFAENAVDSGRPILQNGKWTHLVCSYDGQYQHIFADGLLVATSAERYWQVSDGDGILCVGHIAQDNGDFKGKVDEVRIYNYQLTNEEIADLYLEAPDKEYVCADPPQFDFDGDCLVTINDFVDIAAEWLLCGTYPTCVTEVPD